MLRLSKQLTELLVLALGRQTSVLHHFTRELVMNLDLRTPPLPSNDPLQFGAGAHTDFGALTILLRQPGADGLQVHSPSGEWTDVPAVEDLFVVNMGDLVQMWTDGEYSSTVHQIINQAGEDWYSVPCSYHGHMRATNPFRAGRGSGETVEGHLRRKFDAGYGLEEEKE